MALLQKVVRQMEERFVVLGSNSFAGATLVSRLIADGEKVLGINRSPEGPNIFLPHTWISSEKNYEFFQGDLNRDLDLIAQKLKTFKPTVVIDLAGQGMVAESWINPAEWYLTNIVAKAKLHEILKSIDSLNSYIRVSTPEVYGSQENVQEESWSLNPSTPYAVSHAAIDLSLRAQYQQYKFPVIFTRFANFYGPAQQLYRIVPRTIIQALTGGTLNLHGGGTSIRAFIYGDDVANAIRLSVKKGKLGEIYHFSTDEFISIKNLVQIICQQLKVEPQSFVKVSPDRPGKDLAYLMSSNKAKTQLGWSAKTNLESGIGATIDWVKSNLQEIKSLPQEYIHKS